MCVCVFVLCVCVLCVWCVSVTLLLVALNVCVHASMLSIDMLLLRSNGNGVSTCYSTCGEMLCGVCVCVCVCVYCVAVLIVLQAARVGFVSLERAAKHARNRHGTAAAHPSYVAVS